MLFQPGTTRRQLLSMIGLVAGSSALYQAMTGIGHAAETDFAGPPNLQGAKAGASVLVLGAGLAGMLAAYELRKAGYKVRILEYQNRAGGRNWSLRGGDSYTELGGATQNVAFASGNYLNPGPWRIPYHHRALLHYTRTFGIALEPFIQVNHNAYLHNSNAYGGKPQRYRTVAADFHGHVAELLAKGINQGQLDQPATKADREAIIDALRGWGGLNETLDYTEGAVSAVFRGYDKDPSGGVNGAPVPSAVLPRDELIRSGLWRYLAANSVYEMQTTLFQPVGGMDQIGKGFARQVKDLITFNAKVTKIAQNEKGVAVSYEDHSQGGAVRQAEADWAVVTIPLSVLSQIDIEVSAAKQAAIQAVPYATSLKIGLEFKRRFWEEDDAIYGGISYTNQEISTIAYPNHGYQSGGKAVLLGAYAFGANAYRIAGLPPEDRIKAALAQGAVIHRQYHAEFDNGVAVAWNRVPWSLGCCAIWTEQTRKDHYQDLVSLDGRIVLAGEHASYVGCWQEGAILSSLDAITRLHQRAVAG
jgi:monoamine oxidase